MSGRSALRGAREGSRRAILVALCAAFAAVAAFSTGTAFAATPDALWHSPEDEVAGSSDGRLQNPEGLATNPTTGDIYVADGLNFRVSQYTAWGDFVRSWGWGVIDGSPEFQICGPGVQPPVTCQAGIEGTGAGQFEILAGGIAVDPNTGDVYVGDMVNHRVQKFDEEGNFLLMFGGGVNKTTAGDVCTAASGDICGSGVAGEDDGTFKTLEFGPYLAVGPGSPAVVYVGDQNGRIQSFQPSGAFQGKTILTGPLAGKTVRALAVDASERLYVVGGGINGVYRYTLAGSPDGLSLPILNPGAVALDEAGNVYAIAHFAEVVEFSPSGQAIIAEGDNFATAPAGSVAGLATNAVTGSGQVNVYTSVASPSATAVGYAAAWGPPPDLWPPPLRPPAINAQYAISVSGEAATLKAEINPRYWSDTSYYVEYGTGKCSSGACNFTKPAPPGTPLGAGLVGVAVKSKDVLLAGLTPKTTYYYRFVAQSTGSSQEPVRGVGGKVGLDGVEGSFTTPGPFTLPANTANCSNSARRFGSATNLPDCRAYEMVSPVNKGGDILPMINTFRDTVALYQSATDGGKLAYSTYRAFGDAKSAPYVSQYVATRIAEKEWSSHGVSPARGIAIAPVPFLDTEFRAFSDDLCRGWIFHDTDPLLATDGIEGYVNLYKTRLCGPEEYVALNPPASPIVAPEGDREEFKPDLQGVSSDGETAVFRVGDRLTPEAATGRKYQVYVHFKGQLHLACVLPNGAPLGQNCTAGSRSSGPKVNIRTSNVHNALSSDASTLYWTAAPDGPGPLYVRINPTQPQSAVSGEVCLEADMACTVKVGSGRFWSASPDGDTAIYQDGDELLRFDLSSRDSTVIASGVIGVAGASEDASRVYFVSSDALDGDAIAGRPNLYFREGSSLRLVATLSDFDAQTLTIGRTPSVVNFEPVKHSAQATPDGRHLVFMSTMSLTGYDNVDALSGKADTEVYVYNAITGVLNCVSCKPTNARPRGKLDEDKEIWIAGQIATAETQLYTPHVISLDGSRVFFDSYDSLVPGDSNSDQDVYQWERSPDEAHCEAIGGGVFSEEAGGCLSLISSGQSPIADEFIDASANGADVFFTTGLSLLPQDPGQIDIYDARVDGGLPIPNPPKPGCEGDACQNVPPSPQFETPSSLRFEGSSNISGATRCGKGKRREARRGKARCIAKKSKKQGQRTRNRGKVAR